MGQLDFVKLYLVLLVKNVNIYFIILNFNKTKILFSRNLDSIFAYSNCEFSHISVAEFEQVKTNYCNSILGDLSRLILSNLKLK